MKCPKCDTLKKTEVVDSRATDNKTKIRRRRHCTVCDYKFTTYEVVAEQKEPPPTIKLSVELEVDKHGNIVKLSGANHGDS